MSVEVFKNGVLELIDPLSLHDYLRNGYSLSVEPEPEPVDVIELNIEGEAEAEISDATELNIGGDGADLVSAREMYFEKFGEMPHHRMKTETILENLNANKPA